MRADWNSDSEFLERIEAGVPDTRGENRERAATEGGSASERDIQKTCVGRSKLTVVLPETRWQKHTEDTDFLETSFLFPILNQ